MTTATEDRVLIIERTLPATPEEVFDAWTRPDLLVQWWGPEGMSIPQQSLDVRVGGRWETTMLNSEGGEHFVSGVYKVIERPNRLVFSWAWRQPDGSRGHETDVEVTFTAVTGGTHMTLAQRSFESPESRDSHGGGWNSSLNCLEKLF